VTSTAGHLSLVDFHCHLDLYPDHAALIDECERERIFTLAVTTTPRAWVRNQEMTAETKYVRAALGLHPQLVAERAEEIAIWEEHLSTARYVGEVGLDAGPKYYKSLDLQKKVFERVLRGCARAGDKILTLHTVRAASTVLDMMEALLPPTRAKAVLHWFTGTQTEARRAAALGCYFSINGAMLRNERHAAMVASLPLERLLTETDGPFTQVGDKPARPKDVITTAKALAALRRVSVEEMMQTVQENLKSIVSS
jgi:TatD DNase family protein